MGPVRLSDAGPVGDPQKLHPTVSFADREGWRSGAPPAIIGAHQALHPAPHEIRRRHGTAAQAHHPSADRAGPGSAGAVRNDPGDDACQGRARHRRTRDRPQPCAGAGCAAEIAAGLLRPPAREAGEHRSDGIVQQVGRHAGDGVRNDRRRAAHPAVFPVHLDARPDEGAADRGRYPLRRTTRRHGGSRGAGACVRSGGGAAVPHQPESGRAGVEPRLGRYRHPLRSMVESGGRGSGVRSRASHRPDQIGVCLQTDRRRHGGRTHRGDAGAKGCPGEYRADRGRCGLARDGRG